MEFEANFESRLHKTDKSVGAVSPNQSFLILRQDNRIVFRVLVGTNSPLRQAAGAEQGSFE